MGGGGGITAAFSERGFPFFRGTTPASRPAFSFSSFPRYLVSHPARIPLEVRNSFALRDAPRGHRPEGRQLSKDEARFSRTCIPPFRLYAAASPPVSARSPRDPRTWGPPTTPPTVFFFQLPPSTDVRESRWSALQIYISYRARRNEVVRLAGIDRSNHSKLRASNLIRRNYCSPNSLVFVAPISVSIEFHTRTLVAPTVLAGFEGLFGEKERRTKSYRVQSGIDLTWPVNSAITSLGLPRSPVPRACVTRNRTGTRARNVRRPRTAGDWLISPSALHRPEGTNVALGATDPSARSRSRSPPSSSVARAFSFSSPASDRPICALLSSACSRLLTAAVASLRPRLAGFARRYRLAGSGAVSFAQERLFLFLSPLSCHLRSRSTTPTSVNVNWDFSLKRVSFFTHENRQ